MKNTNHRKLSALFGFIFLILPVAVFAGSQPKQEVMVAMRDGIKLATNIYLPEGKGPWPVVVTRTPYNKNGADRTAGTFNDNGYALVSQDVRGRYASEGVDTPFEVDMPDGYDTVEWIAKQSFSNGKVGIFGTSAPGITSNLAAAAAPPHLVAAIVTVAPDSLFFRSRFVGGIFKESHSGGWLRRQGISEEAIAEYKKRAVIDQRLRDTDFLYHRQNVEIPIYNIGGWHDIYAEGSLYNYLYLQNDGHEKARGKQKLFMGAFGHGALQGGLEYPGGGSLGGNMEEQLRWWDYWLKGKDNGIMDEPPITYYMMASAQKGKVSKKNRLIQTDTWPPKHEKVRFYLQPDMSVSTTPPTAKKASKQYQYDPTNPAPTVGGQNLGSDVGPRDQREIGKRQDYLRFETETLKEDVVVAGHIDMELFASTDGKDTDFVVKLIDVYPDGYEALILDYPIRARFRNGREAHQVSMMTPNRVEKLLIDMWSTAQTFEKGHKIAIHVTSSNFPRFDINKNQGEPLGDLKTPPRTATNTIYFDAEHPSAMILPVISAQ